MKLSRNHITVLVAGAAAALLAGLVLPASSQPAAPAPTGEELGHVRFESAQKFDQRWVARRVSSDIDFIDSRAILFQDTIATPTSTEAVDIVATVAMNYRTSLRDRGVLRFDFIPADAGLDDEDKTLDPGPFSYSSPRARIDTTSTFVWAEKGVEAGGQEYTFQLETGAVDVNRDGRARASGRKVTVVIEMWPAD